MRHKQLNYQIVLYSEYNSVAGGFDKAAVLKTAECNSSQSSNLCSSAIIKTSGSPYMVSRFFVISPSNQRKRGEICRDPWL